MDENRLLQIEAELQRLNQRIDNLKSLMLGAQAPSSAKAPAQTKSDQIVSPVADQTIATPKIQLTTTSIGKYASLGVVSVIFFVMAAVYALKLAFQLGALTPQGILFLLTAVGVGLICSGYMSFTADKKFQSFLPVTGVLILNGVFYTATAVYSMLNPMFALVVTLGLSGLSIFLYEEFRYDLYWIISVLGAYFFPNLLQLNADVFLWNTFLVISSIGFVVASILVHKRPISLMACICAFVAVASHQAENIDIMPVAFLTGHLAVFLLGFVVYFRANKKFLAQSEAFALFVIGVFFFIYSNLLTQKMGYATEMTVAGVTIVAFLLIQFYVTKVLLSESKEISHASEALYALNYFMISYFGFVIAVSQDLRPLFVLCMLGATGLGLKKFSLTGMRLLSTVMAACLSGMYFIVYANFIWSSSKENQLLTWLWMFAWGVIVIFSEQRLARLSALKDISQKFWVGYYGLAHVILLKLVFDVAEHFGQADFKVFFAAIYAGLFVFLGFKLKLKNLAKSSLPILVFISVLLLFGLSSLSPMSKVISLVAAGITFWGAGFLLRKVEKI